MPDKSHCNQSMANRVKMGLSLHDAKALHQCGWRLVNHVLLNRILGRLAHFPAQPWPPWSNECCVQVLRECWAASAAYVMLLGHDGAFVCNTGSLGEPLQLPWAAVMCTWMLLDPHPTGAAVDNLG